MLFSINIYIFGTHDFQQKKPFFLFFVTSYYFEGKSYILFCNFELHYELFVADGEYIQNPCGKIFYKLLFCSFERL